MKCVKKKKIYKRVSDQEAESLVKNEGWKYCPKHEWRAFQRKD